MLTTKLESNRYSKAYVNAPSVMEVFNYQVKEIEKVLSREAKEGKTTQTGLKKSLEALKGAKAILDKMPKGDEKDKAEKVYAEMKSKLYGGMENSDKAEVKGNASDHIVDVSSSGSTALQDDAGLGSGATGSKQDLESKLKKYLDKLKGHIQAVRNDPKLLRQAEQSLQRAMKIKVVPAKKKNSDKAEVKGNEAPEYWVMELGKYEYGPFDSDQEAKSAMQSYRKILKDDIETYMSGAKDPEEKKSEQEYYKKKADEVKKKLDSLAIKMLGKKQNSQLPEDRWVSFGKYADGFEIKLGKKGEAYAFQIWEQGQGHIHNSGLKFKSQDEALKAGRVYIDHMEKEIKSSVDQANKRLKGNSSEKLGITENRYSSKAR